MVATSWRRNVEVIRDAGRVVERKPLMFATSISWDKVVV